MFCKMVSIMCNLNLLTACSGPEQKHYLDGLAQERCNSVANALELRLSCTNPSIWISDSTSPSTTHTSDHRAIDVEFQSSCTTRDMLSEHTSFHTLTSSLNLTSARIFRGGAFLTSSGTWKKSTQFDTIISFHFPKFHLYVHYFEWKFVIMKIKIQLVISNRSVKIH